MVAFLLTVLVLLTICVSAVTGYCAVRRRQEFVRLPEAFRCRFRPVRGIFRGASRGWPGRAGWAHWAHDVLLLRSGRLPAITHVLHVRFPEGSVERARPDELPGLGNDPVTLRLRLNDGTVVDIAAAGADRERLAGPFLVACVPPGGAASRRRPPPR